MRILLNNGEKKANHNIKEESSCGCIGRTADYWYLCDYFGDSKYRIRAQISIDGNEDLINAFEDESETKLSEAQEILIGGLKLLNLQRTTL